LGDAHLSPTSKTAATKSWCSGTDQTNRRREAASLESLPPPPPPPPPAAEAENAFDRFGAAAPAEAAEIWSAGEGTEPPPPPPPPPLFAECVPAPQPLLFDKGRLAAFALLFAPPLEAKAPLPPTR
ncbi:unnamed protein product, partial [Ectocarpus sp. 12 AP-2014]